MVDCLDPFYLVSKASKSTQSVHKNVKNADKGAFMKPLPGVDIKSVAAYPVTILT